MPAVPSMGVCLRGLTLGLMDALLGPLPTGGLLLLGPPKSQTPVPKH